MIKKRHFPLTLVALTAILLLSASINIAQVLQQEQAVQTKSLWDKMIRYAQTGLWEQARDAGLELLSLNPDMTSLQQWSRSSAYADTYRKLMGLPTGTTVPTDNAVQRIIKLSETHWFWDDFMHYAHIGRFDLAQDRGRALLKIDPDPELMLELAESARYQYSYRSLGLMQENETLRDIATAIFKLVEQGRARQHSDYNRIAAEVARLSSPTTRGRIMALERLKDSGEWAVPLLIEALRDTDRHAEFAVIRRALPQLGQAAVNPLVIALQQCKDLNVKLAAAEALGKIGYQSAMPYLLEIVESDQSAELKAVALTALNIIDRDNRSGQLTAAEAFEDLAEDYYNQLAILAPPAHQDFANIWFWDDQRGLNPVAVDREAFDELMTMRCCESALQLNRNLTGAVSLWLSGFFRLEAQGQQQPSYFGANHADASTFALTAGPEYLHRVLTRALSHRNRPVALMTIMALRRNSGQQSLLYNMGTGQPLMEALTFPDRQVRYSAALAIAGSLPRSKFEGSEQVIPILVEALQQRGQEYALVVEDNSERLNRLAGLLGATGRFADIVSGSNFREAMEAAKRAPSFNLVVLGADIRQPDIQEVLALMQQDHRLAFCPTMVIVDAATLSRVKQLQEQYPLTGTAFEQQNADYLLAEAQEILRRNHSQAFAAELADVYATNAAVALRDLALTHNKVLDLKAAEPALREAALSENRPQIRAAAADALAWLDSTAAQRTLAQVALNEQEEMPLRLMALRNLAISAKSYGSLLSTDDINALYQIVRTPGVDATLQNLAAEAYGSLNLPSAIISQLIIDQISKGARGNGGPIRK